VRSKRGPWDGAQPREHLLKTLREHGVSINRLDENSDWYELIDLDGDPVVLQLLQPVLSETITYLYRRFGELHGFLITDLVAPSRRH